MTTALYCSGNRLLDSLPPSDLASIEQDLTIVDLRAHQSTHSVGGALGHVDFPIDAVLSVVATLKNGDTVEVGTVGSESFVESEAALESAVSSRASFCQVEGRIGRMSIGSFNRRMQTSTGFARSMHHNVLAVLFATQQFTVCNVKHSTLQRCARWLAMTADRVGRPQYTLSRDFLAIMLGVKPSAAVTEAIDALHKAGAIDYENSEVTILDGGILERIACECYLACKVSFTASLVS